MARMNEFYFSEIEKIPLLTLEEEKALATKACSGDKSAQNKLVEANLRFAVKIANQYKNYMDIEDLINEANMGLIHAAKKYNPNSGSKFSTYAVFWIRAYIQKAVRETSTGIRFPATRYNEMSLNKWKIASLDKNVVGKDDETVSLGSLIADNSIKNPEEIFCNDSVINNVHEMLDILKENERFILVKRFGLDGEEPMSLSQIGTLMGFTKERIRQIEHKALMKLRNNFGSSEDYAALAA